MNENIHSDTNKIAANTVFQIVSRFVVLLLSLVSIKVITNILGTEGTGYYNTVNTYLGFIIITADFGLFSVAVREISKRPNEQIKILHNVFTIRLIASVSITALGVGLAFFTHYPPQIKLGLLTACLYPIFNLISSVYDVFFQYKLEMQKVAISEIFSKVITTVFLLILAYYRADFYYFAATIPVSALLIFLCKMFLSRTELNLKFSYDKSLFNNLIKMSIPLGIVFIVNNLYFKVDTLILFALKGASAVGVYSVAYRVLETTLFAGSYLSSSLKPLLSTSVHNDKEKTEKALHRGSAFLIFMALFLTITCVTFSREIIILLSNESFVAGKSALIILGFVSIFLYLSGLMGEILIALDLRKTLIFNALFILVFNVVLNLQVIPKYSYTGAAATTLISEIVLFTLTASVVKKHFTLAFDWWRIFKLFIIATFTIFIGFFLKYYLPFLINLPIILILYTLLAYYLDAIPKEMTASYLQTIKAKFSKK